MFPTTLLKSLPLLALFITTSPFSEAQRVIGSSPSQEMRNLRDLSSYHDNRLGECEYDCHHNSDCQNGLVCYHREDGSGKYFNYGGLRDYTIPGCPNNKDYQNDYCVDPKKFPAKTLWYLGSDYKPAFVYPLKECWGDCDKDSDWYVWLPAHPHVRYH
jgi:hypothetical protein